MSHAHDSIVQQICDYMGSDLSSPPCQEIIEHFKSCQNCSVYFDSIKKTVEFYKAAQDKKEMPTALKSNLMKILNLPSK